MKIKTLSFPPNAGVSLREGRGGLPEIWHEGGEESGDRFTISGSPLLIWSTSPLDPTGWRQSLQVAASKSIWASP